MQINLYKILGITKKDNKPEIKKAYYSLSKQHHPDKGGDPEAFNTILKAYNILSVIDKRKRYDNGESVDDILKPHNDKSFHIIADLFVMVMAKCDSGQINIISIVKDKCLLHITQANIGIMLLEKDKANYETFLKKLKQKKNNIMVTLATAQIEQRKEQIEQMKKRTI